MSPNKPIDRKGFQWIKKIGCDCKECPWGQNCIGRNWPHYVEIKDETTHQDIQKKGTKALE